MSIFTTIAHTLARALSPDEAVEEEREENVEVDADISADLSVDEPEFGLEEETECVPLAFAIEEIDEELQKPGLFEKFLSAEGVCALDELMDDISECEAFGVPPLAGPSAVCHTNEEDIALV